MSQYYGHVTCIDQSEDDIYLGAAPDLAMEDGEPGLLGEAKPLASLHPPVARDGAPQSPELGNLGIHALKSK